jgi:hypothetical protein
VWSVCLWLPGIRKLPKISGKDWIALAPIGACRILQLKALKHALSVCSCANERLFARRSDSLSLSQAR